MSLIFYDFLFCLIVTSIVNLPDLYSIFKSRKTWVPVNCPPFAIGDDYHYFMEIAELHKIIFKKNSNLNSLTGVMKITIVSLLVNIPFYHLGYFFGDRRYAILSVRVFNSYFLFLSFVVFFKTLIIVSGVQISNISIYVLSLSVFILYPFYFLSPQIRSSIFFNLFNKKHIFKRSNANELVRSVQMSTTAPLVLMMLSYTLFRFYLGVGVFDYSAFLIFFLILLFSYAPIGLGYGFFLITVMLKELILEQIEVKEFIYISMIIGFLSIIIMRYQFSIISKCSMTNEVFGNNQFSLKVSRRGVLETVVFILCNSVIIFVMATFYKNAWELVTLIAIASFFALPMIFSTHQSDRFWIRGFLVIHMSLLFFALSKIFLFYNLEFVILLFQIIFLIIYFHINSKYLYETYERKTFDEECLEKVLNFKVDGKPICTDSIQMIYFMQLYSERKALFQHFSAQNNGYLKNIERFVYNFKVCGYAYNEIYPYFKKETFSSQLLKNRSKENFLNKEYMGNAKSNELVFMTTYLAFNNKIVLDGFYSTEKQEFTESFFKYLETTYIKQSINKKSTYEIICQKRY